MTDPGAEGREAVEYGWRSEHGMAYISNRMSVIAWAAGRTEHLVAIVPSDGYDALLAERDRYREESEAKDAVVEAAEKFERRFDPFTRTPRIAASRWKDAIRDFRELQAAIVVYLPLTQTSSDHDHPGAEQGGEG